MDRLVDQGEPLGIALADCKPTKPMIGVAVLDRPNEAGEHGPDEIGLRSSSNVLPTELQPNGTMAKSSSPAATNVRTRLSQASFSVSALNESKEPRPTKAMFSARRALRPFGRTRDFPGLRTEHATRNEIGNLAVHRPVECRDCTISRHGLEKAYRIATCVDLGDVSLSQSELKPSFTAVVDDHSVGEGIYLAAWSAMHIVRGSLCASLPVTRTLRIGIRHPQLLKLRRFPPTQPHVRCPASAARGISHNQPTVRAMARDRAVVSNSAAVTTVSNCGLRISSTDLLDTATGRQEQGLTAHIEP